jgi:3-oxoacyl-[acyl-carrier-protein] synthase-1
MSGHTLGAAGALEAAFCWLALAPENIEGQLPPHVWDGEADTSLPGLNWVKANEALQPDSPRRMMSNSFAFGGNNVSLIIGEQP